MALNLNPSSQEQQVQEQQVQERQPWEDWKDNLSAFFKYAQNEDQYAWSEEERIKEGGPRCRYYANDGVKGKNPTFQIFFRNIKDKTAIQEKIDAVFDERGIKSPRNRNRFHTCSDEYGNFSIFINENRPKRDYVFKRYLVESITGCSFSTYQADLEEEALMDDIAENEDL